MHALHACMNVYAFKSPPSAKQPEKKSNSQTNQKKAVDATNWPCLVCIKPLSFWNDDEKKMKWKKREVAMNDGTVLFLPPIKYERDIVALSVSLALSEKNEDHTHTHTQTQTNKHSSCC